MRVEEVERREELLLGQAKAPKAPARRGSAARMAPHEAELGVVNQTGENRRRRRAAAHVSWVLFCLTLAYPPGRQNERLTVRLPYPLSLAGRSG